MALRAAMTRSNLDKRMMVLLGKGSRSVGTVSGTSPKMKAYASTAGEEGVALEGQRPKPWGKYIPVYEALGMIGLSVVLGLQTVKHQFAHSPGVRLKKSRRETVPEVVEPEHVAREADNFIKKSWFRKIAHVQEFHTPLDDPIHGNPLVKKPRVESLKSVGVDPREAAGDLKR